MLREGKSIQASEKSCANNLVKIAAPKPVRPRPLGFAPNAQAKWIQASPVKTEDCDTDNKKTT